MWRHLRITVIAVFCAAVAYGQATPAPVSVLQAASRNYSQAKYYHIAVHLTEDLKGELSGHWSSSSQTAIVAPNGRYRFEARGPRYSWLQVSNGSIERIYKATTQEYTQNPTPADRKPSHFGKDEWSYEEDQLVDAHEIPRRVTEKIASVRNPDLIRSETLSLDNGQVDCFVIRGQGKYHSGEPPNTKLEITFWIEKGSHFVRRIEEHWEGELIRDDSTHYTRTNVEIYPVVDIEIPALPAALFEFQTPAAANLVASFKATYNTLPSKQRPSLVGTIAPELSWPSPDGNLVSLSSVRGRPTLVEFWATWCGPCVAAFAKLETLYSQAIGLGIVIITIDEDEQAKTAEEFLAKHRKSSWSNYHDDGEINRSLPGDGLPQFVLMDASGKIVHAGSGFDEHDLRTALSRLGPAYASLAKKPN
jgi:cytochrome c biogenesis protein CcmG, thiol:disulfide interchange protein DsbE